MVQLLVSTTTKVCAFEFCTTTTRDPTKGTSSNSLSSTRWHPTSERESGSRSHQVSRAWIWQDGSWSANSILPTSWFEAGQSVTVTLPSATFAWRIFWSTGMTAVHQDRPKLPSGIPAAGCTGKKRKTWDVIVQPGNPPKNSCYACLYT